MSYTAQLEKISKITVEQKEVTDKIEAIIGVDGFKQVKKYQRNAITTSYLYSVVAKLMPAIKAKKVLNKPLKDSIVNEMIKTGDDAFLKELRELLLRTPAKHLMNAIKKKYDNIVLETGKLCNEDPVLNDLLIEDAKLSRAKAAAKLALNSAHSLNVAHHGLKERTRLSDLAKDFEGDQLTPLPQSFYEEHMKHRKAAEDQQWQEHIFGETVAEGQPYKVAEHTEDTHVETKVAQLDPPPPEVNIDPTGIDERIPEIIKVVVPGEVVEGHFIPLTETGELIPGGVVLDETGKLLPDVNGEYPKGHQLQVTGRLKKSEPTYLQLSEKHNPDKK